MFDYAKVRIDVEGGGKCSPKCFSYRKGEDGKVNCYYFREVIKDDNRCQDCLEPEVYEEDILAWRDEVHESEITKNAPRRISMLLKDATITNVEWQLDCNVYWINVTLADGTERKISINDERISVVKGRIEEMAYWFRPWV